MEVWELPCQGRDREIIIFVKPGLASRILTRSLWTAPYDYGEVGELTVLSSEQEKHYPTIGKTDFTLLIAKQRTSLDQLKNMDLYKSIVFT